VCVDSGVAGADASIESMAADGLRTEKAGDALIYVDALEAGEMFHEKNYEKSTCITTGTTNNVFCCAETINKKSIAESESNEATVITKVQGLDIAATETNVAGMFFIQKGHWNDIFIDYIVI